MTHKVECPSCHSNTTDTGAAFTEEQDCPVCGLSHATWAEVHRVKSRHADAQLQERLTEALLELGQLRAEVERLRRAVTKARAELEDVIFY